MSSRRAELTTDPEAWDARLAELGGHLLQSWRWGEFKRRSGWDVDRIATDDGSAMVQVLYRKRGPVSVAYVPRGPAWSGDDASLPELIDRLERAAKRRRAIFAIVEQEHPLPVGADFLAKWSTGPDYVQPGRTVKIPLADDNTILMGMHQKTRYSVRLATRKGVTVESFEGLCEDGLDMFYSLLDETSKRNEFGIHSRQYYRDFLDVFGSDSLILVARVGEHPAAGLIAAAFGQEAIYMYGGSSTEHRAVGAAFLVQFEAMRWARDRGIATYDLWGIPHTDPEPEGESADTVPATRGDDWRGLTRFKTGFGGSIVDYPPPIERQFSQLATRIARQYMKSIG
jgi:lipid II:glycine glycyltransferase (peptidoglycan interpeptide bridge formation enzyme)